MSINVIICHLAMPGIIAAMNALPVAPDAAKPKVRIQSLDVIRGVSMLGILAVNADGFAAPMIASLRPGSWPFGNQGWTAWSYWIMDTLFHEKFVAIFSMLFGVSLFLVGGELSDRSKGKILARRLAVLFLFGMLHGFGIWWGDILSLYAVCGLAMFLLRSLPPRVLLGAGAVLFVAMACRDLPAPQVSPVEAVVAGAAAGPVHASVEVQARVAAQIAEATSSWAGAYRLNTHNYLHLLSGDVQLLPPTLALMMIGLGLFKFGFFSGKFAPATYRQILLAAAPGLVLIGWLNWQQDVLAIHWRWTPFAEILLSPLVALGYAAGLILLLIHGFKRALDPIAALGRMAFTNYLTQSLIMTTIFYGGRLGLMGKVDRPALWGIVICVWALQLVWSPLWMSRFSMGPFEWVWRCLTYGRRVPIRK